MTHIRAIYENGVLKLLDPIELQNGEVVELSIQRKPEAERVYLCANERYTVSPEKIEETIPLRESLNREHWLDWESY